MRNYICIIILGLVCCIYTLGLSNKAFGQELDYSSSPQNKYKIAVLPVKPPIQEIFGNGINYIGSRLTQKLRTIPGIQTLNMASSLRILKRSKAKKNFRNIENEINNSELPDPYDLFEVASTLDANKIMIVAGSFDTQKDILSRSKKSMINPFAMYSIKPNFDYCSYIYLFDPTTGNLEWSNIYQKRFSVKDFFISTSQLFESPIFTDKFNKYSVKVSDDVFKQLHKKFYETESASVTAKIVPQPALTGTGEATEGEMTTDGHPIITEEVEKIEKNEIIAPATNDHIENTDAGINTPYSNDDIKEYKSKNTTIEEYQENILNKY